MRSGRVSPGSQWSAAALPVKAVEPRVSGQEAALREPLSAPAASQSRLPAEAAGESMDAEPLLPVHPQVSRLPAPQQPVRPARPLPPEPHYGGSRVPLRSLAFPQSSHRPHTSQLLFPNRAHSPSLPPLHARACAVSSALHRHRSSLSASSSRTHPVPATGQ